MAAQSKLKKNILKLILISVAGSVIYGLPYFRSYYYDAYLSTYGLTNTQMGMFGSIFGVMGAVSYLFGGVVADLVSPRKLMSISLVLTGIGGLLHLMHPGFGMLMFIYLLWGLHFGRHCLRACGHWPMKMNRARPTGSWMEFEELPMRCI